MRRAISLTLALDLDMCKLRMYNFEIVQQFCKLCQLINHVQQ